MHGGSGASNNFCQANTYMGFFTKPIANFSKLALDSGFAVFCIDSTKAVTDAAEQLCGKVWDDEVRGRPNLDLPFIEQVIATEIASRRPAGSRDKVFLTGLSSGGFMSVRAASHFDNLVTAAVPVSSGDPYGWQRNCNADLGSHGRGVQGNTVYGRGYDVETGQEIVEIGACSTIDGSYPHEKTWEASNPSQLPSILKLHDEDDAIADFSCHEKLADQLIDHDYPTTVYVIPSDGSRADTNHVWQDAYNQPIVNFLLSF